MDDDFGGSMDEEIIDFLIYEYKVRNKDGSIIIDMSVIYKTIDLNLYGDHVCNCDTCNRTLSNSKSKEYRTNNNNKDGWEDVTNTPCKHAQLKTQESNCPDTPFKQPNTPDLLSPCVPCKKRITWDSMPDLCNTTSTPNCKDNHERNNSFQSQDSGVVLDLDFSDSEEESAMAAGSRCKGISPSHNTAVHTELRHGTQRGKKSSSVGSRLSLFS